MNLSGAKYFTIYLAEFVTCHCRWHWLLGAELQRVIGLIRGNILAKMVAFDLCEVLAEAQ